MYVFIHICTLFIHKSVCRHKANIFNSAISPSPTSCLFLPDTLFFFSLNNTKRSDYEKYVSSIMYVLRR